MGIPGGGQCAEVLGNRNTRKHHRATEAARGEASGGGGGGGGGLERDRERERERAAEEEEGKGEAWDAPFAVLEREVSGLLAQGLVAAAGLPPVRRRPSRGSCVRSEAIVMTSQLSAIPDQGKSAFKVQRLALE